MQTSVGILIFVVTLPYFIDSITYMLCCMIRLEINKCTKKMLQANCAYNK